uniref:RNA helicase n=1 Tax=Odontella aurita TaxID=265563 RepID=A0A7S4N6J6_9STRA|mmetsp:Transcript_50373/g.151719  ORF Transcript_50373/g.151719 Transcript_50373/m.151719 type:complete len:796 (+) Transcript_50373:2-2389(+)
MEALLEVARGGFQRKFRHSKKKKTKKKRRKRHGDDGKGGNADDDDDGEEGGLPTPTPIQLRAWSVLGNNNDNGERRRRRQSLIGVAPTGSGKTLAYAVPMAADALRRRRRLEAGKGKDATTTATAAVSGLVLVPTRELAQQVRGELKCAAKAATKMAEKAAAEGTTGTVGVDAAAIYGGADKAGQREALLGSSSSGKDGDGSTRCLLLAATPGRLLDLMGMSSEASSKPAGVDSDDDAEEEEKGGGEGETFAVAGERDGRSNESESAAAAADAAIADLIRNVSFLVLDEADKLASNSDIRRQVDALLRFIRGGDEKNDDSGIGSSGGGGGRAVDNTTTTCLFSATMPSRVDEQCRKWVCGSSDDIHAKSALVRIDANDDDDDDDGGDDSGGGPAADAEGDDVAPRDHARSSNADEEKPEGGDGESSNENADADDAADTPSARKAATSVADGAETATSAGAIDTDNRGQEDDKKKGDDEENDDTNKKRRTDPNDLSRIPPNIAQTVHVVSSHKKPKKLMTTLRKIRAAESESGKRRRGLCLVFFKTIKGLKYTAALLRKEGIRCGTFHGGLRQEDREKSLNDFRCGRIETLLATDVAARGVHVNNVEYVVNYDFPGSLEEYVHRCGRAGRNGSPAKSYGFFHRELKALAPDMTALLRSSGAWVDPNLLGLAREEEEKAAGGGGPGGGGAGGGEGGGGGESRSSRRKRNRRQMMQQQEGERDGSGEKKKKETSAAAANGSHGTPAVAGKGTTSGGDGNHDIDDDDVWDDGQFAALSGSRIVLKRAGHVSDAEEDDED